MTQDINISCAVHQLIESDPFFHSANNPSDTNLKHSTGKCVIKKQKCCSEKNQ